MKNLEDYAKMLKELGHPARLAIYKRLSRSGTAGKPVGDLQKELDIPSSTLSHHISALVSVSLIAQRREGRTLYCTAQFNQFETLLCFLYDECCADNPEARDHTLQSLRAIARQ